MLYDIPLFVSFQDTAAMRTGYGNVIMGPAEEEEVYVCLGRTEELRAGSSAEEACDDLSFTR
jgi:hypothetical protein